MVHKTALQAAAACVVAAACFIPLHAHAADTVLTPQQTVALLGTSFGIEYYNSRTGITSEYTAELVGTTLESAYWDYNGYSAAGDTIPFSKRAFNSDMTVTDQFYAPALVYRAYIPDYQTSFISSNPADRFNLSFDFSLDLSGLSRFRLVCMPSIIYSTNQYPRNATWTANTSQGLLSGSALLNEQTNRYQRFFFFAGASEYASSSNINSVFCLAYYDTDITGEDFTLNSINYGVQLVRAVSASYVAPDYGYQQEQGGYYYVLVECPIIDAKPVTTTAPVTGTRPATTPANTVDLDTIESQQRVQIEIENDNRNYNAGVFDGINIIIDQLNKIYDEMKRRGDIVVNVETTLGTDLVAEVGAALSSYTTPATMPTFGDAPQMAVSFWEWLKKYPEIYTLMIVGLTLCLAKFIIFRGNAQ